MGKWKINKRSEKKQIWKRNQVFVMSVVYGVKGKDWVRPHITQKECQRAPAWIEDTIPDDEGWFIVWWKDVRGPFGGGFTFDEEEGERLGEGLRYKWYYDFNKYGIIEQHGTSKAWWPKKFGGGIKQVREYNMGLMVDGNYPEYSPEGRKIRDGSWKNGKKHGLWEKWTNDGIKDFEKNFVDGKIQGLSTWWSPDGKDKVELIFKDSYPYSGTEVEWYANNLRKIERLWENGKLIKEVKKNKYGKEIE